MAVKVLKGVANNFEDFYQIFHNALIANGWKVVSDDAQSYAALVGDTVKLNKSGTGYSEKVVTYRGKGVIEGNNPILEVSYVTNHTYAQGSLWFKTAYAWNRDLKQLYNPIEQWYYVSWSQNLPISYHFNIDSLHFTGTTNQNGYYQDWYAGFINPLATPIEYPYPMFLGASQSTTNGAYKNANFEHLNLNSEINSSFLYNKQKGSRDGFWTQGALYSNENKWLKCRDGSRSSTGIEANITFNGYIINALTENMNSEFANYMSAISNFDNNVMLEAIYIQSVSQSVDFACLGSFKSIFKCYGEQQINSVTQVGADKYKIFRVMNTSHFYAFKEE